MGRVFYYALPYGSYPGYSWSGVGNQQTLRIIRGAYSELSSISGAKFVETANTKRADIRVYFSHTISNGGQYEGNGKIKFSNTRKGVTPQIARNWVLHETMHFLGYKASPSSDKWGHSVNQGEIFHAWGSGASFGVHFTSWLRAKYGVK